RPPVPRARRSCAASTGPRQTSSSHAPMYQRREQCRTMSLLLPADAADARERRGVVPSRGRVQASAEEGTRKMRLQRTVVIATSFLVASAATGNAECGWVLWKSQGQAYSAQKVVEDVDAFDTRAACVDALANLEKNLRAQSGWSRISRSVETGLFADS